MDTILDYIENKRNKLKTTDPVLLGIVWSAWKEFGIYAVHNKTDTYLFKVNVQNYFNLYHREYKYFHPCKEHYVNHMEVFIPKEVRHQCRSKKRNSQKQFYGNKCPFCKKEKDLIVVNITPFVLSGDDSSYNTIPVCEEDKHLVSKLTRERLLSEIIIPHIKSLYPML